MGCQNSKGKETTDISWSMRKGGIDRCETSNIRIVSLDPDLGWRRVHSSVKNVKYVSSAPAPVPACHVTHNWCDKYGSCDQTNENVFEPFPTGWIVNFINDRTGYDCETSLVTLSINIATRAEKLAQTFGVAYDSVAPDVIQTGGSLVQSKLESSKRRIYVVLSIPDFDWILVSRHEMFPFSRKSKSSLHGLWNRKRNRQTEEYASRSDSCFGLQLLQNGSYADSENRVLADVPTIGMNIAEQLHRLERKRDNRHFIPTDTFGWQLVQSGGDPSDFNVTVRVPSGETIKFVPEELIMNITQWVQQTYMTSALL